jgi:hypothetical protein
MPEPLQNFENHAKFVPAYHYVLGPIVLVTLIGSVVNLMQSMGDHERLYNASLIVALAFVALLATALIRVFPLQAQDRAIRAEENLRHYVLTGKLLDRRLTVKQIVGLRFASDAEFPELAKKAAEANMPPKEIKRAVKTWRADFDRL